MRYLLSILLFAISLSLSAQLRSPFVYYKFDNTLADSSGNNYHLKAYGNAGTDPLQSVTGGYSLYLDGSGDYVRVPIIDLGSEFVISFWLRTPTDISAYIYPICVADGSDKFWIRGIAGNELRVNTNADIAVPDLTWTSLTFHNVVTYFNKTTGRVRMWYDGAKVTMIDSTIGTSFNSNDSIYMGVDMYRNAAMAGNIDEVLMYKDLDPTESQIDSIYNLDYLDPVGDPTYDPPQFIPSNSFIGRARPTYGLQTKYMTYGQTLNPDTIKYFMMEDFESWTDATVQSKDSLERRFPMSWINYGSAQNSIIDLGGEHGKVWNWLMYEGGNYCNEFHIHLNDTAKEAIYEFDLWLPSNFNPDGITESATKFPGGFYMSNSFASTGTDTVTVNGLGGWAHNVGGTGTSSMRLYAYHQATSVWPESTRSFYSSGTWNMPLGYWQHNYIRVFVGDPGKENAFIERAVDGVVVAVVNNLKFRSATQGEDFGNIEAVRNSYQFGGSGTSYASQQNQSIRIDNMIAYTPKPTANNYRHPARSIGDVVPSVALTQSELSPPDILVDETYTNASDTIYDVGNGKHYLYQPYNKRDVFTKTVERPSGTINFTFLREEFGYYESSPINSNYWIKVYKWTDGVKDALPTWTFGRSEVGFTNPSGTYATGVNKVSFEYNIGYNAYETRGTAIRYFQP